MNTGAVRAKTKPRVLLILAAIAVIIVLGTVAALYSIQASTAPSRQETVAERGAQVMPFDLEKTTHRFEPTPNGGVETVVAKDPHDTEQIALIQEHLQKEANLFRQGRFTDPAAIHGHDMPGLKQLEAGASQIRFEYTALPDGARITYTTSEPQLIDALHKWFAAQVSDHGQHVSH